MASAGKIFEEDFHKAADKDSTIDVNRLKDPVGGQSGVRNICDFIVYSYPHNYYLELKSRQGNTLNFKEITRVQWDGLTKKMGKVGAIPGVLVHFSDHSEVYFVHMSKLIELRDELGRKSLHIDTARVYGIKLVGTVKRTRYDYAVGAMLEEAGRLYGIQN